PGYRPSAKLAEFVRMRDLHCRFPGCTVPADRCDLDHTDPWPYGPTHPSNIKCLCRRDHLLKTSWDGPDGRRDQQLPDATILSPPPTAQPHPPTPDSRLFSPTGNPTPAALPPPRDKPPPASHRGLKMPQRQRTRTAEHTARIKTLRALNDTQE